MPDFVRLRLQDGVAYMDFISPEVKHTGEYLLKVKAKLNNYYQNTTELAFYVSVYEPKLISWSQRPFFEVDLINKFVPIGQSMTY